jgi:anthranilate synthase component 1
VAVITKVANFDLAKLCKLDSKKYPFLLESVIHNKQNRYSIAFAFPEKTIRCTDVNFLAELQEDLQKHKTINTTNLPFIGGYFVYFSYEFAGILEPHTQLNYSDTMHIASATYIPVAVITDHQTNTTYIVDETGDKTSEVQRDITHISDFSSVDFEATIIEENGELFKDAVEIAKQYIVAGDIFQANISRQWQVELSNHIADIDAYHLLRNSNPAPFAAFASFDEFSILSSSPERLFCTSSDGVIQTRPIAGTRPRNSDIHKDEQLKKSLKNNLKEQAEHLMLLDLERNDLGRVCEYGSVFVDEIMTIESYQFVHHIVSNITGALDKNTTFADSLTALFPGGTITGCPKIRSIQIINELEQTTRGAYTGSLGYISNCGNIDLNILIRTMVKQKNAISFRTGAGIVFDSIAEKELKETNHKADGMLKIFQ